GVVDHRLHRQRHPGVLRKPGLKTDKSARGNADDRYRQVLHHNLAAENGWVEMEAVSPPLPADDRDGRSGAGAIVGRADQAANGGFQSQNREVSTVDEGAVDRLLVGRRTASNN
ncbi:MAG TPA: hypothetical protein VNV82_05720, partial [Bryobacteraceae bacterium]|nr:hypothetical protein [Bryobacteraceae bacterium]